MLTIAGGILIAVFVLVVLAALLPLLDRLVARAMLAVEPVLFSPAFQGIFLIAIGVGGVWFVLHFFPKHQ